MLDFIVKYWVDFILGIIGAGIIACFKIYYNLIKKELKNSRDNFKKEIIETMNTQDKIRDEKMDTLRSGILSIQKKQFINECIILLDPNHIITLDEFTNAEADHNAYNKLGGNHEGDNYWKMVEKKYMNTL